MINTRWSLRPKWQGLEGHLWPGKQGSSGESGGKGPPRRINADEMGITESGEDRTRDLGLLSLIVGKKAKVSLAQRVVGPTVALEGAVNCHCPCK